jgi:hypothetical protein
MTDRHTQIAASVILFLSIALIIQFSLPHIEGVILHVTIIGALVGAFATGIAYPHPTS